MTADHEPEFNFNTYRSCTPEWWREKLSTIGAQVAHLEDATDIALSTEARLVRASEQLIKDLQTANRTMICPNRS